MTLQELTTKLQTLCHEGHSLDEVSIDMEGHDENFTDIEIRRIYHLEGRYQINLVAGRK